MEQYDLIKNNLITFEVLNLEGYVKDSEDGNKNLIAGILKYWDSYLKREIKIFMAVDIDVETEQRLVLKKIFRSVED